MPRTVGVVIDVDADDLPLSRTDLAPGEWVFERWHELREQGEPVTVVTSRTAQDAAALAARGIDTVVEVAQRLTASCLTTSCLTASCLTTSRLSAGRHRARWHHAGGRFTGCRRT